jgi:hypothetical protein
MLEAGSHQDPQLPGTPGTEDVSRVLAPALLHLANFPT